MHDADLPIIDVWSQHPTPIIVIEAAVIQRGST